MVTFLGATIAFLRGLRRGPYFFSECGLAPVFRSELMADGGLWGETRHTSFEDAVLGKRIWTSL